MKNMDRKTIGIIVIIMMISLFLFLFGSEKPRALEEEDLRRNNPGEGNKSLLIDANLGNLEIEGIELVVNERDYTVNELETLSGQCIEKVISEMLGKNESLTNISTDLSFPDYIEGFPFEITINISQGDALNSEGEIITDKAFFGTLEIMLKKDMFEKTYVVKVQGVPNEEIKRRVLKEELLKKLASDSNDGDLVELPKELGGTPVKYKVSGQDKNVAYLLFGFIASFGVILGRHKDVNKEKKKRKQEIADEYPVLLQKMSLYLSAGMNIRNIWITVYEDSKKKKESESPLMQEMGIAVNELKSGIPEIEVYKNFGERTGLPELVRFTALLSQNLKKGSSKLKDLLEEEAKQAYLNRKQRAVKLGEEAGTKLLFPMMLILLDVMIVIIVPAFLSL